MESPDEILRIDVAHGQLKLDAGELRIEFEDRVELSNGGGVIAERSLHAAGVEMGLGIAGIELNGSTAGGERDVVAGLFLTSEDGLELADRA